MKAGESSGSSVATRPRETVRSLSRGASSFERCPLLLLHANSVIGACSSGSTSLTTSPWLCGASSFVQGIVQLAEGPSRRRTADTRGTRVPKCGMFRCSIPKWYVVFSDIFVPVHDQSLAWMQMQLQKNDSFGGYKISARVSR